MPRPQIIPYESISEPQITSFGEVIEVDKWWAKEVRPVQRIVHFDRAWLNDLTTFSDLHRTDFLDGWWQPEVRPVQRVEHYIRHHVSDLQNFDDLFGVVGIQVGSWKLMGMGR